MSLGIDYLIRHLCSMFEQRTLMKGASIMKTVYVVIAYDATAYRLTRVFSTEEKAQAFKVTLKELCWQKITIDRCYVDEQ